MEIDTGIDKDAGFFVTNCFKKGFIINGIQDKILRFAPPLIIEKTEIDRLIAVLDSLFEQGDKN
jgi:acetylornithine/N-succinyldiaminopimelate aminotransferase